MCPFTSSRGESGLRSWREELLRTKRTGEHEQGYTLVEMMLAITILAMVLLITVPLVSVFYDATNDVQNTYAATNQALLASQSLSQYLHEAIAPCPTGNSSCLTTSPYVSPTSNSLTFYAFTGNSKGPAKIVIAINGKTLTATMTQPASGCPLNGATTGVCAYPSTQPSYLIANIPNLTNTSPLSYLTTAGSTCPGATSGVTASSVVAVCVNIQTRLTRGQASGYVTAAYPLSAGYNGSVG
jgi:prepilin-type N-terminal cleavage/methylation domain-containing protein